MAKIRKTPAKPVATTDADVIGTTLRDSITGRALNGFVSVQVGQLDALLTKAGYPAPVDEADPEPTA